MQTWLSRFQVGGGTKNPRLRFHPILLTAFLTRLHVCVDCADMTKPIPGGWGDQKSSFAILPYFAHCIFDPITRTRRLRKHDLAYSGRSGGPKILVCEFNLFCWLYFWPDNTYASIAKTWLSRFRNWNFGAKYKWNSWSTDREFWINSWSTDREF